MSRQRTERRRTLPGVALSLAGPIVFALAVAPAFVAPHVDATTAALIGAAVLWCLAAAVVLYARRVEQLPLASIGWRPLSWRWALVAVGLGMLLSLSVPVLTIAVAALFPPTDAGGIVDVASRVPWWVVLVGVLTAGVTEEILFRGYPIERLQALTGSRWLSGAVSLVCFVAVHAAGWNVAHIVGVVLPLGVVLTGLYVWKRNVLFVMLVHVVINLPLVVVAIVA